MDFPISFDNTEKVVAILAAGFGFYWALFQHQRGKLREPGGLQHHLEQLEIRREKGKSYFALLGRGLDTLDRFLDGTKVMDRPPEQRPLLTWRGIFVCVTISLAYPFQLLVGTWGLGGSGAVGGFEILEDLPQGLRLGYTAFYIIYIVFIWLIFFKLDNIIETLSTYFIKRLNFLSIIIFRHAPRPGGKLEIWLGRMAGAVAVAVAVTGALAGAGAFALAGAGAVAVALAGALAFALAGAVAGTGAFALAGALAFALAGALAFALAGAVALALSIFGAGAGGKTEAEAFTLIVAGAGAFVLFMLLLPWANGVLDWLSWGVTRGLGRRLLRHPGGWTLMGHALVDLIAAVALLAGLAWVLAASVEGINLWALAKAGKEIIPMAQVLKEVGADPFGPQGWWVTSMLLTTLIPTLLHLMVVIFTFAMAWQSPARIEQLAAPLRAALPKLQAEAHLPVEQRQTYVELDPVARFFAFWWLAALILGVGFLFLLLFAAYHLWPSLGGWLLASAEGGMAFTRIFAGLF